MDLEQQGLEGSLSLLKIKLAEKDCWFFIHNYVWTFLPDPEWNPSSLEPCKTLIKKFPDKVYLKKSLRRVQSEPKILIKKSRQLTFTWLAVAYCFWCAAFKENLEIIFQSDKEEKVKDVLFKRFDFIYDRLDPLMRLRIGTLKKMEKTRTFDRTKSVILLTASGANVISSHNPNIILSDEMAIQEWQKETIAGSLPAINNGGQFIGLSSVKPDTYFMEMVNDISKRIE